jgi:phosphate/sulfate permease
MRAGVQLLAYNPNDVKPGWIAFFIVMALLAGTFLLWRNMNKQLGKIKVPHRAEFRAAAQTPAAPADDPPSGPQPGDGKEQSG